MTAQAPDDRARAAVCAPGVDMYAAARMLEMYAGPVHFAHSDSLSMALRDISGVLPPPHLGAEVTLESACLGLTGTVSPLPAETLAALHAAMGGDEGQGLAQWVRIVHATMLSLLHRGINHAEPRRALTTAHTDVWSTLLGTWTAQQSHVLPLQARLRLFAPLSRGQCSDYDLRWMVRAVLDQHGLDTGVLVTPLQGGAVPRDRAAWAFLGEGQASLGCSFTLGKDSHVLAHKNTVTLGPIGSATAQRLDDVAAALQADLHAVLDAALPPTTRTKVRLHFAAEAAAPLGLSDAREHARVMGSKRLGRAFLGAPTHDFLIDWFDTSADLSA